MRVSTPLGTVHKPRDAVVRGGKLEQRHLIEGGVCVRNHVAILKYFDRRSFQFSLIRMQFWEWVVIIASCILLIWYWAQEYENV